MNDSTLMLQFVTAIGQVGTVGTLLVVGWYFLEYVKKRDKEANESAREMASEIKDGVTEMKADILAAVREQDARHQQTITTLFGLTRETIQTVGSLSNSIAGLSQAVQEQRQAIQELRQMIHRDAANRGEHHKP